MLMLELVYTFLAMAACLFGPGYLFVRRTRWGPLEQVVASVALSLVILYALTWGAFLLGLPAASSYGVTALGAAVTLRALPGAAKLTGSASVRRVLAAFALLVVWTVGLQALIRHYSGGEWCCDWVEHYQRSVFFVDRGPRDFMFIDRFRLPARPPLMNVVAAHFLAQTGKAFAVYQVVFSVLNLLTFLSACLIARLVVRRGLAHVGLVAVFFAFNPMFFMNTTFPWTKSLAAFYVILATWFYVVSWRRQDTARMSAAFVSLSAGVLVHYSAGPYALFLTLHYVIAVLWTRRQKLRELTSIVVPSVLLLGTWFVWATAVYGAAHTLRGNTAVGGVSALSATENLRKIFSNLVDTFTPHIAQGLPGDTTFRRVTDTVFMTYQDTLPAALGSVGGLLVAWLLVRALWFKRPDLVPRERWFWISFIVFNVIVGMAANGDIRETSIAHLCLQPMVYMGLAWFVAQLPGLPRLVRRAALVGLAVDFLLGVAFEVRFEHVMADWTRTPNWEWKDNAGVVFLGDRLLWLAPVLEVMLLGVAVWMFVRAARTLADTPSDWLDSTRPSVS